MEKLGLVTANFGGIDDIRPFPRHPDIETFYFTDEATRAHADPETLSTWDRIIVPDYPSHELGPRIRSKYFKQQTHRLSELDRFRWLAWADACLRFKDVSFLQRAVAKLEQLPERYRFMLIPHDKRPTVRAEYDILYREVVRGNRYARARYDIDAMTHQINAYEKLGLDIDAKLWCGTTWLMERNAIMTAFCDEWWGHSLTFSVMDQLSLGVLVKKHDIRPLSLTVSLMHNKFFDWMRHPKLM